MSLTKVSYSMISGAPVSVLDFGADPTGGVDSRSAIQTAIDSGATDIVIPAGIYRVNGSINISSTSAVRSISGIGLVTLKLYTAVQDQIFWIQSPAPSYPSKQFLVMDNLILESNGTAADGLQTYGILSVNQGYSQYNNIRALNFSGAGLELRGCVYAGIDNYTANGCVYGLSFQLNPLAIQCTAVTVERAYISGCIRGLTQTGAVNMLYTNVIVEYCGSNITQDGAIHIAGGTCTLVTPYLEVNNRNFVSLDAKVIIHEPYGWTVPGGAAANVVTYTGTAFDERGITLVYAYLTGMARLGPDTVSNRDLVIGENLVVPIAGGSVKFGHETMASASGTLTSATWTPIYTIPAAEVTGTAVNSKAMHEYTCYAGAADLSTGFDAGTIMNSTLRSYSGATPAWLRLNGNVVEMNVTSSSYGLNYKIVMRRVYPG